MTAGAPFPAEAAPYAWDASQSPLSDDVARLWHEVASGIDKSQTVVWKSAVESLDAANQFLTSSEHARFFVEKYMQPIISILVEQYPAKIGLHERNCVQESLTLAVIIISRDLDIQLRRNGECKLLEVLSLVFNKKKAYYKGNKGNWNNHVSGLPDVRLKMIDRFRQEQGFARLYPYLIERIGTPIFPSFDVLHQVLTALADVIPVRPVSVEQAVAVKDAETAAIEVARAAMKFVSSCSDEALKKIPPEHLNTVQHDLQRIFDKLVTSRRANTYEFYAFWRSLILKLIKSPSLPLRLFGWQQLDDLLDACAEHRPPPRYFDVSSAGCSFVNGRYSFTGSVTADGYALRGADISYERRIPVGTEDGGGKKLTLFRCTMRSQQKWWFLSEADEEQPGTDRDIDYYQHKSKEHEETEPPPFGWLTCRNTGLDPPPRLKSVGVMVPPGEEFNTLEHQLAQWAIENDIIELVLGDSVHREIVSRSTALIKFLASMCQRDSGIESPGTKSPNKYCLQISHLLLAWKTCSRKTDSAVSAQIYQLLVSILPSCPSNLAIPLLKAVQASVYAGKERSEYLNEVADFCAALAAANSSDAKSASTINLADDVRAEVLEVLWSVLTHPDAASLKVYDVLKRYVTNELRVEPKGKDHRERYLGSCVKTLTDNSRLQMADSVDEHQALRMVKLTHFVLEACPRVQAAKLVTHNHGSLPLLLFEELISFLKRRQPATKGTLSIRKLPSLDMDAKQEINALSERLRILRYVYGVSDDILMSSSQLQGIWQLCTTSQDREEVMIFIASASSSGQTSSPRAGPGLEQGPQQSMSVLPEDILSAAFNDEVCTSAFLNLFCSSSITFQSLGEGAYRSFQFLYHKLRLSPSSGQAATSAAIDTLWRICLGSSNDAVASQAMKDLLAVYIAQGGENGWVGAAGSDSMETEPSDDSFGRRVFDCLAAVKRGLDNKEPSAVLAADRCLQILNAAIGQTGLTSSITASTLSRLSNLPANTTLRDVVACLPHSMRGQACYRRISIMAKRTQNVQSAQAQVSGDRDGKGPSTLRFSLDVHPLETLLSVKWKVASQCECPVSTVKPISISGRVGAGGPRTSGAEAAPLTLNAVPDDSVVDELGIVQGCEIVFLVSDRPSQQGPVANNPKTARGTRSRDLSDIFCDDRQEFAGKLFEMLLRVLESLPFSESDEMVDDSCVSVDTHKLVWDLLLAMPTNSEVANRVTATAHSDFDAMEIDAKPSDHWSRLLDLKNFHRSVYVLLAIDAFLEPAVEVLSSLPQEQKVLFEAQTIENAFSFREGFIQSGGFNAVVRFFSSTEGHPGMNQSMARMGNAVALRILKCCLFGNANLIRLQKGVATTSLDEAGARVMQSLSDSKGLLKNLAAMVVKDSGISTSTISDILKLLRFLFASSKTAHDFISLPDGMAEEFLVNLLLWEGSLEGPRAISSASSKVRKTTHDLISNTPVLAEHALPWLIAAIDNIQLSSESTAEFFDVLQNLVSPETSNARRKKSSKQELNNLATMVCKKLASCPRLNSEAAQVDFPTGVLCGCLALLRAIIETTGGSVLREGTSSLIHELKVQRWSEALESPNKGMLSIVSQFRAKGKPEDSVLIDLMGVIFDVFLSPGDSTSDVAICCDKESRQRGFDVVGAATRACVGPDGYVALVSRINSLMSSAAPFLKHRWGQGTAGTDGHNRHGRNVSKYSGLRNQGCTCYMNSFLQQMFMMPELRKSICSAPLPASIRSSGGAVSSKGGELVGKKIALQWENGVSYDAIVDSFDISNGMHTIRYCPMTVATISGASHPQVQPVDITKLPEPLPEEFLLSEGRPGKETGVFEVVGDINPHQGATSNGNVRHGDVEESEEEAASRHLMEEVQRTFIHLDEGSRGRCFDPRALVEASACLKLEFDVWQQNDASEFATKLLDRLETTLRRWAPDHFRYLDHTFGLKQAKQKICKECGLKTNREEKLLNVDCQIRGKSDILEALGSMTEVEIMEGDNQVFCDRCKKNTDTVLRTAISTLPNMLILSLKRFDLDYNTFETVKLNSRCAFGQTLNMKQYTLEGLETMEKTTEKGTIDGSPDDMDTRTEDSGTSLLPDEDYEYKLVGVLVHAGVAQGGHYYSFIKDRSPGSEEKWYRFDDEDVTPFDPSLIEVECFGGKVKKETKWPNGQVHTVESEQYANALMLFYEKVKPTDIPPPKEEENKDQKKVLIPKDLVMTTGYDVFEPDVKLSNVTHQWQTFLFDAEFQAFLKGLLGLCRMSNAFDTRDQHPNETKESVWKRAVVQMLLTFVFDVFLYSNDRYGLGDWVSMLEEIMDGDRSCAQMLLATVASKTKQVSGNWLRTYLSDCPDQVARTAGVRIFSAAFRACLALDQERSKLEKWTKAWVEQLATSPTQERLPCTLSGNWESLEKFESMEASSMGTILSFVNVLIEASPRNWRYSPELNAFIRNLASIDPSDGGNVIRQAMVEALIPARLICSVIRERAPRLLRSAFPGSSVSVEVAETQIRPESNASTPMMAMGGNHPMNPTDGNYRGCSLPLEYLSLFEALGCFLGIKGIVHSPLVVDVDEARGRPRVSLSDDAVDALRELFAESCAQGAPGMGKREIESYLQKCGIDSVNLPTQKIEDIMAKYPTTGGNYLSLDGFLAYYQDTVQTNEMRVRLDLHTHGFRPDLSRRPVETRIQAVSGRTRLLTSVESVAMDVAVSLPQPAPSLGKLADMGLDSFALYTTAYSASEAVAEYILSAAVLGRKTDTLLINTLKTIYTAPTGWVGNEILNAAIMVLRCMASVPDSRQRERINLIMQCNEPPAVQVEYGVGLLVASKAFHGVRHSHNYPNDVSYAYDRYVGILKELLALQGVYVWMSDNQALWTWMERDLLGSHQHPATGSTHGQVRVDYNVRIEGEIPGVPLDDHAHSDSEGMPDIHGSEEDDDEESRYEDMDTFGRGPSKVLVEGAGNPAVNGIYVRDGVFEDASKFSRNGEYAGKACNFSVFQCNVSNNTKHWYISIVPAGGSPGTRDDTDFYSAPVTETCTSFPPLSGWTKSNEGQDPPPTLSFKDDQETGQLAPPGWDENHEDPHHDDRNTYV